MKVKIFLSYSRSDEDRINILRTYLDKHDDKIEYWLDSKDLKLGQLWRKEIFDNIINCQVFLFCLSKNSIRSLNCQLEILIANYKNKNLRTISLENTDPEFIKSVSNFIDSLDNFDPNAKWSELAQTHWTMLQIKQWKLLPLEGNPDSKFEQTLIEAFTEEFTYLKKYEELDSIVASHHLLNSQDEIEVWEEWWRANQDKFPQPSQEQWTFIKQSEQERQRLIEENRRKAEQEQQRLIEENRRKAADELRKKEEEFRKRIKYWSTRAIAFFIVALVAVLGAFVIKSNSDAFKAISDQRDVNYSQSLGLLADKELIYGDFKTAYKSVKTTFGLGLPINQLNSNLRDVIPHVIPALASYKDTDGFDSVAISPDGQYVLAGNNNGKVLLWEWQDCKSPRSYTPNINGLTPFTSKVAFSPNGQQMAVAFQLNDDQRNPQDKLWVWTVDDFLRDADAKQTLVNPDSKDSISQIQYTPDGRFLVAAQGDSLIFYDISNSYASKESLDTPDVFAFAFSHKGNQIITLGNDNLLWTENADGKFESQSLDIKLAPQDLLWSVIFSNDDRKFLTKTSEGAICIWNVASALNYQKDCYVPSTPATLGYNLAVAPDSTYMLMPDHEGDRVVIYDYAQQRTTNDSFTELGELYKHSVTNPKIAISGDYVVTGAIEPDSTIRVWDWQTAVDIDRQMAQNPDQTLVDLTTKIKNSDDKAPLPCSLSAS